MTEKEMIEYSAKVRENQANELGRGISFHNMSYIQYKKYKEKIMSSGNTWAMLLLINDVDAIISRRIFSYRYNIRHLDKSELNQLHRINGLNEGDVINGDGSICRLVGKKNPVCKKVGEIDLFLLLDQIEWIKEDGGRERVISILSNLDSRDKHYKQKVKLVSDMIKNPHIAYLCPTCLLDWCKSVGIKVKNNTEDRGSWWTASLN